MGLLVRGLPSWFWVLVAIILVLVLFTLVGGKVDIDL